MKFATKRLAVILAVAFVANLACGSTTFVVTSGGNQIFDVKSHERQVSESISDWVPEVTGGVVFNLSLDSRADILLIDATLTDVVGGTIYNVTKDPPFGLTDHNPPVAFLIGPPPPWGHRYAVDLWVTTPAAGTSSANNFSLLDGDTVTHFDTGDDGAVSDFNFAQVTLIPDSPGQTATATLVMSIQTAADPVPIVDDVTVTMVVNPIPEPSSLGLVFTALLVGIARTRKRCFLRHSSRELVK